MQNDYDFLMKWNDRLRQAFTLAANARGINQTDLARACDVSSPSVTDWFNGETKSIQASKLILACKFLEVSPFWVMLGDESNHEFSQMPPATTFNAAEMIRLITLFAQMSDDGREKILFAAEETKRLFPRA